MQLPRETQPGFPIQVDGVFNVRSFGGYPSNLHPNCVTRSGFLYRSAHPTDVTTRGLEQLRDLGISHAIDLTNSGEAKTLFTESENGLACRVHSFALAKHGFSVQQLSEKYLRYIVEGGKAIAEGYLKLLVEGHVVIRDILLLIRDNPNDVFLIHCAMGKDRTGVTFAVLLALAGVSNDLIAEEYSRSEACLQGYLPQIAAAINKAIPDLSADDALIRAGIVIQTRKDAMALTLQMVEEQFGGMTGYLTECCGIGMEDIQRIQDVLAEAV